MPLNLRLLADNYRGRVGSGEGDARRYSRRLPSGSGNNRGGPEIVVSPDTPFLDGGIRFRIYWPH